MYDSLYFLEKSRFLNVWHRGDSMHMGDWFCLVLWFNKGQSVTIIDMLAYHCGLPNHFRTVALSITFSFLFLLKLDLLLFSFTLPSLNMTSFWVLLMGMAFLCILCPHVQCMFELKHTHNYWTIICFLFSHLIHH